LGIGLMDIFQQDDSATQLTEYEKEDLIPTYISTRKELNRAEQDNILAAEDWAFRRRRDVLNAKFLKSLHQRMFGDVWKWAGKIRNTERNIGISPHRIRPELMNLLGDCRFWIDRDTYTPDEIAARFHHRLVFIHPFPNGNGRHSRLSADLLLAYMGQPPFTWGSTNLVKVGDARKRYISALRKADKHDYAALLKFVRS